MPDPQKELPCLVLQKARIPLDCPPGVGCWVATSIEQWGLHPPFPLPSLMGCTSPSRRRRHTACKPEYPRHGSLGLPPHKWCKRARGEAKASPKNDPFKPLHLMAFLGYKAGMTHVIRGDDKPGFRLYKKEIVDAVAVIECSCVVVVGIVGYVGTSTGLRVLTSA